MGIYLEYVCKLCAINSRLSSIIPIQFIAWYVMSHYPYLSVSRLILIALLSIGMTAVHASDVSRIDSGDSSQNIIGRIEPPSWWVGMQDKKLQLMVHGQAIAEYSVKTNSVGWEIVSIKKTDNKNYLFINLLIDENASAGSYKLNFSSQSSDTSDIVFHYPLAARRSGSLERQGFNASDVIYLITPDRFANGDYENDQVEELKEGINRRDHHGRHGGDIQGVIDHLDYIHEMGFTQIWLNPVLENDHAKSSYHGYSTTDYYNIDKRFGSNQLYQELSQQARSKGLGIIKDVILNHIGTEHWWMQDLPSKDWINNNTQYAETTHRRESLHDPHGTVEDIDAFASGWFVPTMADLNQRNPLLANYLIQNNIWWTEFADLSGIRVDTFSYSDKKFLAEYTRRLMQEYPNFNIVAEEWSLSPIIVSYWQRGNTPHDKYRFELPSLMDFPLQDSLIKGLLEKETWSDGLRKLYETMASDFVYADPYNLVVFADNHDMSRVYTQLEHDLALTKIAVAYFATTRGIPQYFYGTEILMDNRNTESHGVIRTDFPGGWKLDKVNAFNGKGLKDDQQSMQSFMRRLLNWRKSSSAVHKGKLTHYAPTKGVYVYFRQHDTDKVMIILNKGDDPAEIDSNDYPSMLSAADKAKKGLDVISGNNYPMDKMISIPGKSAFILQL